MSKPTKFTPGVKGDIFTDSDTGIKYKCLGRLGFCDTSFRDEPIEYSWAECHPSEYGCATTLGAKEERVENAHLAPTVLSDWFDYDYAETYSCSVDNVSKPNVADKLIVLLNGKRYDFQVKEGVFGFYVGNEYIAAVLEGAPPDRLPNFEDTGVPFYIRFEDVGSMTFITKNEAYKGYTIEIKKEETIITPIDEKWLPEPTVFYYNDGPLADADGNNISYEQAAAAGRDVVIIYTDGDSKYECYPVSMYDNGSSVIYHFFTSSNSMMTTSAGSGPV